MGQFYGIFQDIKELNMGGITELGIYEGIFSNVYANMKNSAQELDYYIENAFCVGKSILEIKNVFSLASYSYCWVYVLKK